MSSIAEIGDGESFAFFSSVATWKADSRVGDAFRAVGRGHVVIGDGEREFSGRRTLRCEAQAFEGLRLVTSCTSGGRVENGGFARFVLN